MTSPPEFIEQYAHLNFPPIIRRSVISKNWLSEFMKKQLNQNGESLSNDPTIIQTFHGKSLFLSTEIICFYHSIGMKIDNIQSFIQYKRAAPLRPFVSKVTKGRQRATLDGNDTLGLAYKLVGNSGMKVILMKYLILLN